MRGIACTALGVLVLLWVTGCMASLPAASPDSLQTPTAISETGSISGRLTYRLSGEPAGNYMVLLGRNLSWFVNERSVCTDSEGYYSFSDVPAGYWAVVVSDRFADPLKYYGRSTRVTDTLTSTVNFDSLVDPGVRLISPASGSTQETQRPTFRWEEFPGASEYRITLEHRSEDGSYSDVTLPVLFGCADCSNAVSETQVLPLVDLEPGHYRWKVEAWAEGEVVAWCDCASTPERDRRCSRVASISLNYWEFDIPDR
jgi:hypothetical protein